jgi:hypothetical protein
MLSVSLAFVRARWPSLKLASCECTNTPKKKQEYYCTSGSGTQGHSHTRSSALTSKPIPFKKKTSKPIMFLLTVEGLRLQPMNWRPYYTGFEVISHSRTPTADNIYDPRVHLSALWVERRKHHCGLCLCVGLLSVSEFNLCCNFQHYVRYKSCSQSRIRWSFHRPRVTAPGSPDVFSII